MTNQLSAELIDKPNVKYLQDKNNKKVQELDQKFYRAGNYVKLPAMCRNRTETAYEAYQLFRYVF